MKEQMYPFNVCLIANGADVEGTLSIESGVVGGGGRYSTSVCGRKGKERQASLERYRMMVVGSLQSGTRNPPVLMHSSAHLCPRKYSPYIFYTGRSFWKEKSNQKPFKSWSKTV
ncbi:hypothetical protein CEXT_583561 [Caerostris extrusa]|uniref:Uncharacterized protein n=1 Tax=Caerostris extrusa TaxID=172846 RepID=A0AAV4NPH5_CAEEX|nr:hypothetical protein CEXT_583561 [Caerostris extrusa]